MTLVLNGTTGVSAVDGSASTPAIQGNDTNTGVFFPAADTVAVATGGSERVRVDSSGNLGIGTSSPSNRFVVSNSGAAGVEINPSTGNIFTFNRSTLAYTDTTLTANNIIFQSGGATERARIDSSGNLLVGTTSTGNSNSKSFVANVANGYIVVNHLNGQGSGSGYASFGYNGGEIGYISQNGTTAVAYNTTSDYRLKENIQPMIGALAKVAQLKPVTYTWKVDGSDGQGFIAHELQEVVPDCVTGEKDAVDAEGNPIYQGVDTSFLVATLTAAIQELNAKVESLTAEIATLKGAQA